MTKTFYFHDGNHHKKADTLISALLSHGWEQTKYRDAKIIFIHADTDRDFINQQYRKGKLIMRYPHAGSPYLINDFDNYPISPYITAGFVPSIGQANIERAAGIDYPLEVIGWHLCMTRPFFQQESYRKVLFAPIHPNVDGALSHINQKLNCEAFEKLLPLVKNAEIELTVRYIGKLENNGLRVEPGVKYVCVIPEVDTAEIDQANVVIGHQTFAYLAVARGIPTLMMGEDIVPRMGSESKHDFQYAKSWMKYMNLLRYPLDILCDEDPRDLSVSAIQNEVIIADWKERMIGKSFNADYFVSRVESYL